MCQKKYRSNGGKADRLYRDFRRKEDLEIYGNVWVNGEEIPYHQYLESQRIIRPMRPSRIHPLALADVKPANAPTTVWDKNVRGLALRTYPGGAEAFVFIYRIDGRQRLFTIGRKPEWSLDAARTRAKELRREVDRGYDPAGDKRERREARLLIIDGVDPIKALPRGINNLDVMNWKAAYDALREMGIKI